MSDFRFDVRVAIRSLLRRKLFCAVVIATLGLGIGANSAIFSIVNAVLIKPLPYRAPNELALIWSRWNNFDKTWLSPAEYLDYKAQTRLFTDVASWDSNGEVALTGPEGAESMAAVRVTANTFSVLGITPEKGRTFFPEEDIENGPPVVMLGWNLWQGRFRGDPNIVGRTIQVDGTTSEVVGVLPRDFRLPLEFQSRVSAQIITPLGLPTSNAQRGNHGLFAVARLQPGVTTEMVTTELRALTHQWTTDGLYPESMQFTAFSVSVNDEVSGKAKLALVVLSVAVALLLLLTCVNVANLILIRANTRNREIAVRAALGAGRRHILRLALMESVILGLAGGVVGTVLAWVGVRVLVARAPTTVPRLAELGFDVRVLLFTIALSLGTGLLFGIVPAWRATRLNLSQSLRDGERGQSGSIGSTHARSLLVITEMALAVLLVLGAGLTVRSFSNLMSVDPGFRTNGVLTMAISLPAESYESAAVVNTFWEKLRADVNNMPDVEVAGLVRVLPIAAEIGDAGLAIENRPTPPGEPGRSADWQAVSGGYFDAMRIPIVSGRAIDDTDTPDGIQVIVVNQTLVREYFADENPLGRRIRVGGAERPWRTIVGVVADNHHNGLTAPMRRAWFIPSNQWANSYGNPRRSMSLVVRARANPNNLIAPIAALVKRMDPNLPLTQVRTLDNVIGEAVQEQRFTMTLMAGFAGLALLLASVGIYGVIAYSVTERTREIGIRIALGADPTQVRALILRQGMIPAAIGILVGLFIALLLSQYIRSMLYGIAAFDVVTFTAMPVLLLLVAACAVLLPAMRASRVQPLEALRG